MGLQHYIAPYLIDQSLQTTDSLDKANASLAVTQKSSDELLKIISELSTKVEETCTTVKTQSETLASAEKEREGLMKELKEEIEGIKAIMPKVFTLA